MALACVSSGREMSITLHRGDLPAGLDLGDVIAVDSETMGLQAGRDRLCVVQLSAGDGDAHLVQLPRATTPRRTCAALLADPGAAQAVPLSPASTSASCGATSGSIAARSTAPRSRPGWCAPTPTGTG